MLTVNELGLTPARVRCLAAAHIVENPNGTLRVIARCVSRWRDRAMIERCAALAYLQAERRLARFRVLGISRSSRRRWIVPSTRLIGR
ncbi:MAG: hypothetical protein AB1773_15590 [Pseudomonadota bacterium]